MKNKNKSKKSAFPEGFLWGTATAAHQVEGGNRHNDFWHWEKSQKLVCSGNACRHYDFYRQDFRLIKDVLSNNSYRFSIEWSRIEPAEGKFDPKEVKHYKDVLLELRKLGIEPIVTLFHFTSPKWFSDRGGWEKRKNLVYFERFVKLCVKEYGDLVNYWTVINEPTTYILHAYLLGFFPPMKKSLKSAAAVYFNLAEAHKIAFRNIKEKYPDSKVSSAIAMNYFKPVTLLDKPVSGFLKFISNDSFLALTSGSNDFIGVNHYFAYVVSWKNYTNLKVKSAKDFYADMIHRNAGNFGWSMETEGIKAVIKDTWDKYKKPILITENGIDDAEDDIRQKYITECLGYVRDLLQEGIDIFGYQHWSLMDNYEWSMGRDAKFGLFQTDFKTFERTPRKSALMYSEIAKTNGANL